MAIIRRMSQDRETEKISRDDALEAYFRDVDRQTEPRADFFVGRHQELASFSEALTATAETGGTGQTFVCQGAPGAGKTALLRECAAEVAKREEATGRPHVAVPINTGLFGDIDGFLRMIDGKVLEALDSRKSPASRKIRGLLRKLVETYDRGITIPRVLGVGPKPQDKIGPAAKLNTRKHVWRDVVIVLLVDEAQNILAQSAAEKAAGVPESPESKTGKQIAEYLHAGPRDSNILLACFGLSDTVTKLVDLGIARGALKRRHDLAPLSCKWHLETLKKRLGQACELDDQVGKLVSKEAGGMDRARQLPSTYEQEKKPFEKMFAAIETERKLRKVDRLQTKIAQRLSRIEEVLRTMEQAFGEAHISLIKTFGNFGVEGAQEEQNYWAQMLGRASQGWPQHLRIYTEAALREIKANGMTVSGASLERALAKGEAGKKAYYDQRLENVARWMPAYRDTACALQESCDISLLELKRLVGTLLKEWDASFDEFLADTVHAGVLGPVAPGRYAIAIPSFARRLLEDPNAHNISPGLNLE